MQYLHGVLAIVALLCLGMAAGPAQAGTDVKRTIDFLGFNADGSKYLLKITDANTGNFLSLRSFATGKQEKSIPLDIKKEEKKKTEDARTSFKITDKGVEATKSPDGKCEFFGVAKDDQFRINCQKGEKQGRWQTIKITDVGASGNPAKVTLKTMFWSADGHKVVVILHKTLVDENGIDADEAKPYDYFLGGINTK
jgi:hypothetical protein